MNRPFLSQSTFVALLFLVVSPLLGQGYDDPLTIQGLDRSTLHSAASRAAGGTTIGIQNDAGVMFLNPASLQSLKSIQVSLGGSLQYSKDEQIQLYAPLKYYSNFSLLMEGLTGHISDPHRVVSNPDAGDTVQRPFDNLGPNWSRTKNRSVPVQFLLAVPFSLGDRRLTAGAGVVQYADLNHYYQNNNVLSPAIGSDRPVPTPLPRNDSLSLPVQWYQYLRSREGSIRGYGVSLAGSLTESISLGVSGMVLKGSTDDFEQHLGRGLLVFYTNYFRLDSVYNRVVRSGTSDYSGQEWTFSGIYRGRYVSVGFSVQPPLTISRSYSAVIQADTTGSSARTTINGEDKLKLLWRGRIGITIAPVQNLTLGLEYEIRSYASAVYTGADGSESSPWLSSSLLHVGVEYGALPWLALRAGVRGEAEVYEPAGNPIIGEPVTFSVYSAGCGINVEGVHVNIAYEYAPMRYEDTWQTNVNLNSDTRHTIIADLQYEIPW